MGVAFESAELTNAQVRARRGLQRVQDPALLQPFVERYFAGIEALWADRPFAIADSVARGAYPRPLATGRSRTRRGAGSTGIRTRRPCAGYIVRTSPASTAPCGAQQQQPLTPSRRSSLHPPASPASAAGPPARISPIRPSSSDHPRPPAA